MFNRYYSEELTFLREMGKEFSQAHPDAAHFLAEGGSDPDVERLLEGFAFLTARLRQKLDDELPEITQSLMSLLWPHYLRPIPSSTIVQFRPKRQKVSGLQKIPRGTVVDSVPVERIPCRFRTCYSVEMYPLDLDQATLAITSSPPQIRLNFRLWDGSSIATLGLERLKLHLHGDLSATLLLYLWLHRHLNSINVFVYDNGGSKRSFRLPPDALVPGGFSEDESLLPYPRHSFPGFRLLQEYYTLPSKFLFFDLTGLSPLRSFPGATRFEVVFEFSKPLQGSLSGAETILLNCTPVVNLFEHQADPIRVHHEKAEYKIKPVGADALYYEIYSLDRVFGIPRGTAEKSEYLPFYSFAHPSGDFERQRIYYQTRVAPSVVGYGTDTFISFVYSDLSEALPPTETISIDLTCTNRWLPTQLRPGDIRVPTSSTPEFATFENLTQVTTPVVPPLGGNLHWRLISHLALSYRSLGNAEVLRNMLSLYNFQASYDRRAARGHEMKMAGIRNVKASPCERLLDGALLRGTAVEIEVQEDQFAGEGDLYLFANLVNEVCSLYGTINSFTQFSLKGLQQGEIYKWPPRIGTQSLV